MRTKPSRSNLASITDLDPNFSKDPDYDLWSSIIIKNRPKEG